MFNRYQLSPVNFPSESSPLPSPGIELKLFWVCYWILQTPLSTVPCVLNHFSPVLILQLRCFYCFSLALLITGSHIVLISILGWLRRFLWPSIWADSLSWRIFQWCSLSMISAWSHRGRWFLFFLHMWSATPDFSTSPGVITFWCSWSLALSGGGRPVFPLHFLPQLHGIAYTQSTLVNEIKG